MVGGKFNGVDIRFIMKDIHLQELANMLPVEAETFISYLRSIKELQLASVGKEFSLSRCQKAIFYFEINFWFLHEAFNLPMSLKVHVIIDHYAWYFTVMGKNFCETNVCGICPLLFRWP